MDVSAIEDLYDPQGVTPSNLLITRRRKWSHVWHLIGFVCGIIGITLFVVGFVKHWNVSFVITGLTFLMGSFVFLSCAHQLDKVKLTKIYDMTSHIPCRCFHSEHTVSFEEKLEEIQTDLIGPVDIRITADNDATDNATSPMMTESGNGHHLMKYPEVNTLVLQKTRDSQKEKLTETGAYLNPGFGDSHL